MRLSIWDEFQQEKSYFLFQQGAFCDTILTIKEILPNGQEDRFITNDDEVEKKMIQSIEEKKEKK